MATNAVVMAGLIADKIVERNSKAIKADIVAEWIPICEGLLAHLVASAEILPGTFQDSIPAAITGKGVFS